MGPVGHPGAFDHRILRREPRFLPPSNRPRRLLLHERQQVRPPEAPLSPTADPEARQLTGVGPPAQRSLADVQNPGLDALRLLRALGLDTPLILVTGTPSEGRAVKCLKEGVADYVIKGDLARLPAAVRLALQRTGAEGGTSEAG